MFKIFEDSFNDSFLKFYFQALLLLERRLRIKTNNALTLREVMVLGIIERLAKTKKNTASNIASYLQVSPPVISTSIKSLIRKGYLIKKINHEDNRFFFLELSEKGHASNKNSHEFHSSISQKVMRNIGPLDLKGVYKLFKAAEEAIDQENKLLDQIEKKQ
jgi:DNA-binding MarR family transcriptional regulator